MRVIKIQPPETRVDVQSFDEVTHRYSELHTLLRDCDDMPDDHPLKVELRFLKNILDTPLRGSQ